MKKHISIVMALTIVFCAIAMPVQVSGANENITSIKSGETVYGSPGQNAPEDYSIMVSADGKMTIALTTDNGVVIAVTDSSGKEIAPTEYYVTAGGSSLFTNVGRDAYGYYLSNVSTNKADGAKVGSADFIYNIKKGDYIVRLRTYHSTISSVTMIVTTPAAITAKPTSSAMLVNGENVAFDAYNIEGNNYFKLRDLAYILNGTEKQFDVGWDGANNAISLTSGRAYTVAGGEMQGKGSGDKTPAPTSSKILLDGQEVAFTAYNIEGNNYFKLRDIGEAVDFGVDWDGTSNTIVIDTSKGYA